MRKLFASVAAAALVTGAVAVPAAAQSRGDQASAREEMKAGRNLPMRGHEYLSFEYDVNSSAYRLKLLKEGQVVWVDVDARTARILRISR